MTFEPSQSADAFPEDSHSSESALVLNTEQVQIEQLELPPGQADFQGETAPTLFVDLSLYCLQAQDGKTHIELYRHDDMWVTLANTPLFMHWEGDENCLRVQLSVTLLKRVAAATLGTDSNRLTLVTTVQSSQQQLAALSTLLIAEAQEHQASSRVYLNSLATVLAVQLLRNYRTTSAPLPSYEGGLPTEQLHQIRDYIDAGLTGNIKVADLARLLNMGPLQFARMFKQSRGISPHQYVIQQRLERAKYLLKHSDLAIIDIALECGFNSHRHLSQQFRKAMGMTPRTFRC